MAFQVTCSDLGIAGCDFVARGATPGDVVHAVVEHVNARHDINLPDADTILRGNVTEDPLGSSDQGAALIVQRLHELLDTQPAPGPDTPAPSLGRIPPTQ